MYRESFLSVFPHAWGCHLSNKYRIDLHIKTLFLGELVVKTQKYRHHIATADSIYRKRHRAPISPAVSLTSPLHCRPPLILN